MKKIAIYCETQDGKFNNVSYELISKANSLKKRALELKDTVDFYEITAVAISPFLDDETINNAYRAGADNVALLKNDTLQSYELKRYADIFTQYYFENSFEIILFGATPFGRMLAPRITTILDTGLVADCTDLDFILDKDNEVKLAPTRPTFGAELMATILSKNKPQCATIRPNTFSADFSNNNTGIFIEKEFSTPLVTKIKLLNSYKETNEDRPDYSKAKIILTAGAGLATKDNSYFQKLKDLAEKLNVHYAVTRKVVDLGIESPVYQIGQTGSTAAPELYVAFGVSGAIQHIFGMKNSKTVVAVNNNEKAPIFQYCDYKIVDDAKVVIDEILKFI